MQEKLPTELSMQEYLLGMYLQTLMDFYYNPEVYGNELSPKFIDGMEETIGLWWTKYEDLLKENLSAHNNDLG